MKSLLTKDFLDCFRHLPSEVQELARKNYRLWKMDHQHPSLKFKSLQGLPNIFSVRIGRHWRAVGEVNHDTISWFWVGSHAEYDQMIS